MEMTGDQLTQHDMDVQKALATFTEQIKSVFKRLDEQKALTETVHKLAVTMEFMAKEQARQAKELEELKSKSGKRWDAVVGQIITVAVGAGIGFVMSKIFGG